MQEHESWQMPEWWCREKRPSNDSVYFENMCRVIFQAGLNWHVIDNKWATTKKAFSNFDIEEVACYTDSDVQRLLKDTGIIRNKGKILAIIQNAQNFVAIKNASAHSKNTSTASINQTITQMQQKI